MCIFFDVLSVELVFEIFYYIVIFDFLSISDFKGKDIGDVGIDGW